MPVKLSTTIRKIEDIPNITNRALLTDFHKYLPISFDNRSKEPKTLKTDNRELYDTIKKILS